MTVSSSTARNSYNCNGSQTVFPYTFRVLDESHLQVILRDSSGSETTLTLTTHYTVSGVDEMGGGNVTTVATYASGYTLVILRSVPIDQLTDYVENDAFPAESHEEALDKLTMILQSINEEFDRCLKVPKSSAIAGAGVELNAVANNVIGWDASGTSLSNYATSAITISDFANLNNDYGNDVAAAILAISSSKKTVIVDQNANITADVSSPSNITWVFIDGAMFNISAGQTATFASPVNIEAATRQQVFTGAGAVSFTNPGTVYPEWWGVDGSSDETEINLAFASLSSGGTVECAAASYSIDGSITPANDTTLKINPWTTITLAASSDVPMIAMSGKSDVIITGGGILDGNKANQVGDTSDHIIYAHTSSARITVDNVIMQNSYDDTLHINGVTDFKLLNSKVAASRDNGMQLTDVINGEVAYCYFTGNVATTGTANIAVYTGNSNIRIHDNTFTDSGEVAGQGHGIFIETSEGVLIANNFFDDMFGLGIEVNTQNVGDCVTITGNTFKACGNTTASMGTIWVGEDASAVIANNVITDSEYHGIYLYKSDRCVVTGNVILNVKNSGYHIVLSSVTYCTVLGNIVGDTGGSPTSAGAISIDTATAVAVGNVIAGSTVNYIENREDGVEAAANYETLTNWRIGNSLDGLAGQVATLTGIYTLSPGYAGVYVLDPGGAHRNVNPGTGFKQGTLIFLVNAADAAENLVFDSAGLNQTVGQNQRGIFAYTGSAWVKIYVG